MNVESNLKDIFQEPQLRELIGSNNILNNKVIYLKPTIKSSKFAYHVILKTINTKNITNQPISFTSFTPKMAFKIYQKTICLKKMLFIYLTAHITKNNM